MARTKKRDALEEKLIEVRTQLGGVVSEFNDVERDYYRLMDAKTALRGEFDELLRVWVKLHPGKDAQQLWPPGFDDIDVRSDSPYFRPGSDLDAANWELWTAQEALHVDELIRRVHSRTGRQLKKASIVAGMSRLANKGLVFVRTGANTFTTRGVLLRSKKAPSGPREPPAAPRRRGRPPKGGRK